MLVFPGVIVVFVSAVSFACDSWLPADVAHNWATNGDVDGGRIGGGSTFGYMWYLEYRDTDRVGRSSLCLLCRGSVTIFQWFVSCPEISFAYATIFFQLSRFFFGGFSLFLFLLLPLLLFCIYFVSGGVKNCNRFVFVFFVGWSRTIWIWFNEIKRACFPNSHFFSTIFVEINELMKFLECGNAFGVNWEISTFINGEGGVLCYFMGDLNLDI